MQFRATSQSFRGDPYYFLTILVGIILKSLGSMLRIGNSENEALEYHPTFLILRKM